MARQQHQDGRRFQAGGPGRPTAEQRRLRTGGGRQDEDFGGNPHLGAAGDPAEGKLSAAEDTRG